MAIGISAAAIALGLLAPGVLFEPAPDSILQDVTHLLLRLALSLSAGAFSMFFLRLHGAAAKQIRYYHNELTNIDLRFIALDRADSSERPGVIKAMAETERNRVLKKGETTTELEESKMDPRSSHDPLAVIAELLERLK